MHRLYERSSQLSDFMLISVSQGKDWALEITSSVLKGGKGPR